MYPNRGEHHSFLINALKWKGSVSPRVIHRTVAALVYAIPITILHFYYPDVSLPFGPFELSGVALGLLLVFRTNSGHDRWWEARKIWGGIVNQSRNLAYGVLSYGKNRVWADEFLRWSIAFPYACMQSLRGKRNLGFLHQYFTQEEIKKIENAQHIPTYVCLQMSRLLQEAKEQNIIDGYSFLQLEQQRSLLIDYIGASERILKTPIPLVYAIKVRRFILSFLILLPFALLDKAGWMTPFFVGLVSYPLFSLDQIGIELQNPFGKENLSHLPLADICKTIERNIKAAKVHRFETNKLSKSGSNIEQQI